jgi:quercetin dioxygenase-like cupin family protein
MTEGQVTRTLLLKAELAGAEGVMMEVEVAPGGYVEKHSHPGYDLFYVLEGRGLLEIEGREPTLLEPGRAVYIEPHREHFAVNLDPDRPLRVVALWIGGREARPATHTTALPVLDPARERDRLSA